MWCFLFFLILGKQYFLFNFALEGACNIKSVSYTAICTEKKRLHCYFKCRKVIRLGRVIIQYLYNHQTRDIFS